MNLPNLLTISRIPLMFIIVGLLYADFHGAKAMAFILFLAVGITDWLDGYLARRMGLVSRFGVFMDALADKIAVLGILIALVDRNLILPGANIIPVLLLIAIMTREFMVTGMRLVAASQGVVVAAEKAGKQKTVTQLIAIGLFLFIPMLERDINPIMRWDLVPVVEWLTHAGFWLFLLATYFTLASGVRYFVKYGRLLMGKETG